MREIVELIEAIGIIFATLVFIIPPIRNRIMKWNFRRRNNPNSVFKAVDFRWVDQQNHLAAVTIVNDSPCDVIGGGLLIEYRSTVSGSQDSLVGSTWWIPPYENVSHQAGVPFTVTVEIEGFKPVQGPGVYPWVARANDEVRWA